MTREWQSEALSRLRQLVEGESGVAALAGVAQRFGLSVESGCGWLEEMCLSPAELAGIEVRADHVARQIARHLDGLLGRDGLCEWATFLHGVVTSPAYEEAGLPAAAVATTLRLLGFLLDEEYPAPQYKLRRSLVHIRCCLEQRGLRAVRDLHPRVLRDMGTLRFCVLEPPALWGAALPHLRGNAQWLDVGLLHRPRDRVRLIPLSIFTRDFFYTEMPRWMACFADPEAPGAGRGDRFRYHPENDQAIELHERYPQLSAAGPRFQYFIDESGLAEIVIDATCLRRAEVRFAIKAFCLLNGVGRATLNGRALPTAPTSW